MPDVDYLMREIQSVYLRLKEAEARGLEACSHYIDALNIQFQQRLQEIDSQFQHERAQIDTQHQEYLAETNEVLANAKSRVITEINAMRLTFQWAIAGWDDPIWHEYAPAPYAPTPSSVRIGRLRNAIDADFPDLPALAPLIGSGHLFVTTDSDRVAEAHSLLQTILLRLVVASAPDSIHLTLVDPLNQGSTLAAFNRLPETLRGQKIWSREEDIERQLRELAAHIEDVVQNRLGNLYPTVEAYNAQGKGLPLPYRVLALADFPTHCTERIASLLLDVARNGPRAGVYLVITVNPDTPPPRNVDIGALTALGTNLRVEAEGQIAWDDPVVGQYGVVMDICPAPETVNALLDQVSHRLDEVSFELPFTRVAVGETERWQGSTAEGLRVPIGIRASGDLHEFNLGSGIVHHGLIGGRTRSGKTNLLQVLITQLALRYSPEEVQFYLIDLKFGVGFQDYLRLPHAQVVALEADRQYALGVLRRLHRVLEERGELFSAVGVDNMPEYRRKTGKPLPRLVVIIDEFQLLFEESARYTDAERLLEELVKLGAAFGVHILLCSQSPAMAAFYNSRQVYGQMALRIAFACEPHDAEAILGAEYDAAQHPQREGFAVYNDAGGSRGNKTTVQIAYFPGDERAGVLDTIRILAGDRVYPLPATFASRAPALLQTNAAWQHALSQPDWPADLSVTLWLGEPIEIKDPTAAILERYLRANVVIVGPNEAQAYGLLLAAFLSVVVQRPPHRTALYVADFTRPSSPYADCFTRFTPEGMAHLPHFTTVVKERAVSGLLDQLIATLDDRLHGDVSAEHDIYFFVAGFHRWREMRGAEYNRQSVAATQLSRLAQEGPDVGIHLIIWSDSFDPLESALKRGGIDWFDWRVTLRTDERESTNLLGKPDAARLEENRALLRNEEWSAGQMEKFKPYTIPADATLMALAARLRAKAGTEGEQDDKGR